MLTSSSTSVATSPRALVPALTPRLAAAPPKKPVKKFMAEAQKNGLIERMRDDLLLESAMQFLKDNALVEETDPEPEHCDTHSPKEA